MGVENTGVRASVREEWSGGLGGGDVSVSGLVWSRSGGPRGFISSTKASVFGCLGLRGRATGRNTDRPTCR